MKSIFLALGFLAVLVSAGALFSTPVSAGCSTDRCINEVDALFISATGVRLTTEGDESSLNCTLQSGLYLTLGLSHPNYDALVAMLITAYQTHEIINIRIVENTPNCEVSYVLVNRYQ